MNQHLLFNKSQIVAQDRVWRVLLLLLPLLVNLQPIPLVAATTPEIAHHVDGISQVKVLEQHETAEGLNTTVNISVEKDAFLSSNFSDSNFGVDSTLRLGWGSSSFDAMRILIEFDISQIPANSVIHRAELRVYQWAVIPGNDASDMGYRPQFMRTAWSEYGVTWNNANYLGGDTLPLSYVNTATGWKTIDVTSLVKSWYSGARPNYGLIVTGDETPAAGRERNFYSREGGNSAPYIEVEYTQGCDTTAPTSSVEPLAEFSPGTFPVTWNATDSAPANCTPSGVASYDVEYRINGSSWHSWKNQTTATTNHFKDWAENGDFVEVRARATDHAGNVEPFGNPQTSTRIDTEPPQIVVDPLPAITVSPAFIVSWHGTDNLAGVDHYDVQWRENEGLWQTLLEESAQTSYQVTGAQTGVTYDFRVRATDRAGNGDEWPDQPQVTTHIASNTFQPRAYLPAVTNHLNAVVAEEVGELVDSAE